MTVVEVETEHEFRAGAPRMLFERTYSSRFGIDCDVSPDGESFVMIQAPGAAGSGREQMYVVLNWFEELKRLVPTVN
jgi:hypothetical protein